MDTDIPKDSTPQEALHLPFANEDEVQEFVEEHAAKIGLTVIASSKHGGELFEIDVLAVNDADTPFIIECKWDLVDAGAIKQLFRYRDKLHAKRSSFEQRLTDMEHQVARKKRRPVLVAIGYRYEPSVLREAKAQSVVCLTYAYHRVTPYIYRYATPSLRVVKPRPRGEVSIQRAQQMPVLSPHPRVCKKRSVMKRLARLSPGLRREFKKTDRWLRGLHPVWVMYGGKGLVRYQVPRGIFAEARIDGESIQWSHPKRVVWRDGEQWDSNEILKICGAEYAHLTSAKALS